VAPSPWPPRRDSSSSTRSSRLHSLSESVTHLRAACLTLAERCVDASTADTAVLRAAVENSIGLVTPSTRTSATRQATDIAKEALSTGRGVAELVLERGLLPAGALADLLRPEAPWRVPATGPGLTGGAPRGRRGRPPAWRRGRPPAWRGGPACRPRRHTGGV
jgi:hypothetical protein